MIGEKIKENRTKKQMTQKDLADKLFVSSQAVSRWENGDVEPSLSTVKEMAKIFEISVDELLEAEGPNKEEPKVIEKVVVEKYKPVLGVCTKCNNPIFESNDLHRETETKHRISGRHRYTETIEKIYCSKCYQEKRLEEQRLAELKERERVANIKSRRKKSYIIAAICSAIVSIVGLIAVGPTGLVLGVPFYAFIGTMILNNTFVNDMWESVASWGFVKMPGIIFSLDFDGIIFLIATKILLAILSFTLAAMAFVFATLLSIAMSMIVYPFALVRSYKNIR